MRRNIIGPRGILVNHHSVLALTLSLAQNGRSGLDVDILCLVTIALLLWSGSNIGR